jgi:hypothetical protein
VFKRDMITDELTKKAQLLLKVRETLSGGCRGTSLPGYYLEYPNHPLWSIIDRLEKAIWDTCKTLAEGEIPRDSTELLMDCKFLEALLTKGMSYRDYQDQKSRRLKHDSFSSLKLHRMVTGSSQLSVKMDNWDDVDYY